MEKINVNQNKENKIINYNFKIGLSNIGNTCFMNSSLQNLLNIEPLNNFFLINNSEYYQKSKNTNNTLGSNGEISDSYLNFLKLINEKNNNKKEENYIEPIELANSIYENNPLFDMNSQRDAYEFLLYFIDILHEDVNLIKKKVRIDYDYIETYNNDEKDFEIRWDIFKKNNNSFLIKLFYGMTKAKITCQECLNNKKNTEINIYEPYSIISLSLYKKDNLIKKDNLSIYDLIKNFEDDEILEGEESYPCSICNKKTKQIRKNMIYSLPNYLIFHIERTVNGEKLKNIIDFPLNNFELKDYVLKKEDKDIKYDLIGIINHYGNSGNGGHYIAICKKNDKWFQFNDSDVSEFDSKNLISENTYCLFYRKNNLNNENLFNQLF
jgi:ubiquitin carboxyl-terminal hydrolase 8